MGILDDAIRQHLDLKRERGATESELKQLEDEAFGPPTRPGEPDFPDAGDAPEQSGNGVASDSAAEHPIVEEPAEAPEPPSAEHPAESQAAEPLPGSEEPTTLYDETSGSDVAEEEVVLEEPSDQEAEHDEAPEPEPPIESLETVEHPPPDDVIEPEAPSTDEEEAPEPEEHEAPEEEHEAEDDDEDDVLADTPDFLKDAPEDDELWFEQGKPKDFDF